jgi:lipoprotein-anchoring transpeptidase ErfK/SrfK
MDSKKVLLYVLLGIVVLLPYLGVVFIKHWYNRKVQEISNAAFIVVNKEDMQLSLIDYSGKVLKQYGIACGKNYGDKQKVGDMKTPEGVFHISSIEKSDDWTHDFGDGNGEIKGAYGPWFLRLETPGHQGIGIHGTHKPESIGTRDTEGCIRLKNEDLVDLKSRVYIGMTVIITPSSLDVSPRQKQS